MELRHLRYFLAVAQELHFSRAAELLHISQPPLSRQIQDLEREIGVALFRRNRRVELTEAGAQLLERAQRVVDALDEFSRAAEQVAAGVTHTLRLGYPATTADPAVSRAVRRFKSACPDVDLHLVVDGSGPHLKALRTDLLDAAFVRTSAERLDGLAHRAVMRDPLVVLTDADHRLAEAGEVTHDQLRGVRLVLPEPAREPDLYAFLADEVLGDLVPAPSVVLESCGLESVYSAVVAGLGSAIVPRSSAALLADDRVVWRRLRTPGPPPPLQLVWDPDRVEQPLATFIDELSEPHDVPRGPRVAVRAEQNGAPGLLSCGNEGPRVDGNRPAARIASNGRAAAGRWSEPA